VLSSHLPLSASTERNGEHSPGACAPRGPGRAAARGTALVACMVRRGGVRGSKRCCLLGSVVMGHSTLLSPECTCNAAGHSPGSGLMRMLALLQPAAQCTHASHPPEIPSQAQPWPTCALHHTVPSQGAGLPRCERWVLLTWAGDSSCSTSTPLVTHVPAPPDPFPALLGIATNKGGHKGMCKGDGGHGARGCVCSPGLAVS